MRVSLRLGVLLAAASLVCIAPPAWSDAAAAGTAPIGVKRAPRAPRDTEIEVKPQLRRFIGELKGDYLYKGLVWRQIYDAIPIVGFLVEDGGPSAWLLWSDRPHSAQESGAILLGYDRQVRAAALIYYDPRDTAPGWDHRPRLVVFTRHSAGAADHIRRMQAWARTRHGRELPYKVVWVDRPRKP